MTCWNREIKLLMHLKMVLFCLNIKKKTDDAGYNYVLKDKKFIQKIVSMSEKVNLSLFENFFESSSSAYYEKMLININPDENKEIVAEIRDRISNLKKRIKKNEWKRKKR